MCNSKDDVIQPYVFHHVAEDGTEEWYAVDQYGASSEPFSTEEKAIDKMNSGK